MGAVNPTDLAAQVQKANEKMHGGANNFHVDFSKFQAFPGNDP
jgi:hypothetical protein